MPFVNELISETDKARIGPLPRAGGMSHSLHRWTVNREKDAFLIWLHQDRDAPENARYLFSVQGRRYEVDLRQDIYAWASGESYTYSLLSMGNDGQPATDEVMRLLKEALVVFAGFYGTAKVASVKFKF